MANEIITEYVHWRDTRDIKQEAMKFINKKFESFR